MSAGNALIKAASEGNIAELNKLIIAGVNPDAQDSNGLTALMQLREGPEAIEIARMLLEAGASPHLRDHDGMTALMHAALQAGPIEIAKMLVAAGADIHAKDKDGYTALIYASQGHVKMVEMLLAEGAEVNALSNEGRTALILAADTKCMEAMKMLLLAGADIHLKGEGSQSFLEKLQEVRINEQEKAQLREAQSWGKRGALLLLRERVREAWGDIDEESVSTPSASSTSTDEAGFPGMTK